jgi:rare lipoprotein A (peptidoglycan hydrolase)
MANRSLILLQLLLISGQVVSCTPIGMVSVSVAPERLLFTDDVTIEGYDVSLVSMETIALPERLIKSNIGNSESYEEFGETYVILESSDGFSEIGIASWYGIDFQGRNTSSGEVYDMYQLTAAHKTLPLPTYVRVDNLDNGQSLVVKVNDRGPFIDGRIIDLSYAAAYRLGVTGPGTANVEITALDPSASDPFD